MSEKKQSSIEWLQEQLINSGLDYPINKLGKIFEQAKAMHKEEIKDALQYGFHNEYIIGSLKYINKELEQYYNETFGGNNERMV